MLLFSLYCLLGVIFTVLQTTLLQRLPAWMGAPDLLFVLLVFCALYVDTFPGLLLATLFGLLLDIASGIYLGIHTTMYVLLFLLLQAISRKLALRSLHHQPVIIALSYLLMAGGTFLFTTILAEDGLLFWSWREVLLGTLMVSIFSIPLNQLFLAIRHLAQPDSNSKKKKSRLQSAGTLP